MQRVTSPHAWCKLAGSRYHEYWAGRLPNIQAQLQLAAAGEWLLPGDAPHRPRGPTTMALLLAASWL